MNNWKQKAIREREKTRKFVIIELKENVRYVFKVIFIDWVKDLYVVNL